LTTVILRAAGATYTAGMATQTVAYVIGQRLYLNITDRCTLRCAFCPKYNGSRAVRGHDLTLDHRPEVAEVITAIGDPARYAEVVFCGYGEPTLRLQPLLEIATWIKAQGGRVRVNTDGLANLVHKRDVLPELAGRVDALSVSLNAQDQAVYDRHCRPTLAGSFAALQAFLAAAPRYVPTVTATAIDGLAGVDIDACARLANRLGVAFRRRELDVVG
jgi:TatD family-associated radical SAM protein